RSERPARVAPVRPAREHSGQMPAEIEPRPHASEEDENEEVGRPEGPREEYHVDPYGLSAAPREPIPVPARPSAPLPRPAAVESSPHESEQAPEPVETDDGAVSHFEDDAPKSDETERESTPRPAFGRRPGRSKR